MTCPNIPRSVMIAWRKANPIGLELSSRVRIAGVSRVASEIGISTATCRRALFDFRAVRIETVHKIIRWHDRRIRAAIRQHARRVEFEKKERSERILLRPPVPQFSGFLGPIRAVSP